ncbi:MAG: GIY-YIG nuclease family protein [Chitinophagaceae bacterium]
MYTVYILYTAKLDRYYIGSTGDTMEERLRKHCSDHKGYTGRANDWQIVFTEEHETHTAALKRERAIKNWKSRSRIEALINKN